MDWVEYSSDSNSFDYKVCEMWNTTLKNRLHYNNFKFTQKYHKLIDSMDIFLINMLGINSIFLVFMHFIINLL